MKLEGFLGWICQPGLVTTGIKGKVFPSSKAQFILDAKYSIFIQKMRRLVTISFLTTNVFAFVDVARIANAVQVTI